MHHKMVDKFDEDDNGKLSADEFNHFTTKFFDRLDDEDNKLSSKELDSRYSRKLIFLNLISSKNKEIS